MLLRLAPLCLAFSATAQTPPPAPVDLTDVAAATPTVTLEAPGPRAEAIRAGYTKYEYRVPMRDGVRLFTAVYVPNDASAAKTYPMLMVRTPYSVAPYGIDRYKGGLGPTEAYEKEGFIFVFQDVRGAHMSEGEFVDMRPHNPTKRGSEVDESSDTHDSIDWLLAHVEHHNGKVGQWGVSYPGFYASMAAIDSHPALKAVSPQAPIADWWRGDDMHRHGALNLQMTFAFFSGFGKPRPQPTDVEHSKRFDFGTPDAYQYFLDLGPLSNVPGRFGQPIAFWNDVIAHPDYDEFWKARNILPHLKGGDASTLPEALVFETGANRWRRFDSWPPVSAQARRLYFQDQGRLSWSAPAEDGYDEYPSDPAKPVPYTQEISQRWGKNYMAEDQRFAARRPDVLVYQTAPLEDDLTLAGPLKADLWFSTSASDADIVVKLIDVAPGEPKGWGETDHESGRKNRGGQQTLVRGEPFRGRYRESYEQPLAFIPGQPARVAFPINDVFHTFKRGHRLMIQVQSSWFPFIDRNPQSFVPSIYAAKPEDFVRATHRLYRGAEQASSLEVRVLPEADAR